MIKLIPWICLLLAIWLNHPPRITQVHYVPKVGDRVFVDLVIRPTYNGPSGSYQP